MRKITFFFALLVTMITTAFAQDYTAVKVYQITAKDANRGALYATAESTHLTHCGATYGNYHNRDVAVNESDANQQFAFIEYDGKVYLYSIGAQKFASKDGQFVVLTTLPAGFVTLADSDVDGYKLILFNGENRLNFSGGYAHGVVANYETPDDGNLLQVKEIGTFDATPVIAAIEAEKVALAQAREAFNAACEGAQTILNEAELTVSTEELPLQVTDANAAYYLWCNNPDPGEGPIAQLVDGVVQDGNFFHSSWRGGGEEPHYIEIDLGEGNELAAFSFNYTTRFAVANDYPDGIQVLGSNDKQTYAEVYNVTSGLPQTGGTLWTSPIVNSENAYRYYRFVVTAERTYWHMSEFDICTTNVSVAEKYQAVAKEVATLKGLCDSHATTDAYDAAMYTSAAAAISAAVEAVNAGVVVPVPVTFEVYALDGMMNPSPLEGTVSSLGYVVFAASDNNAVLAEAADAPKVGIFDTEKQSYVAEASSIMFGDLLSNGMQLVAVQFDGFNTPGKYKVHAPAGAFTVNGQPSEEIISAEFTIPAPVVKVFEVESVTPADKEEVEAINKIEIKFTEDIALTTDNMGNFIPVNLVDENDNVIELAVSDDTNVWSKVVLTPATPITAAGTYTLDLSQLQLNGGVCEGSYSWTVVEPVIPLAVVSVTPSEAVESFSSITIEFNKDIKLLWEAPDAGGTGTSGTGTSGTGTSGTGTGATGGTSDYIKLLNSANGVAASASFRNATVNGNNITFKLDATVKTSGTYTFAVPAGLIASTDDESFAGQTFTFTVDAAPAMVSPTSSSKNFELKIDENLVFEFSDEIEFVSGFEKFQLMVKGSDVVAAEFVVGESAVISGKVLTLKVTNAIVPEETTSYTLSIPANAIVKKGSDKAFAGKNMTYNVKAFQIKSVDPVSGSTVQEFSQISIEFNEAVYNYGLNTLTLTNVADNSINVALTGVANGKILTLTANGTVSDGTYKLNGLSNIVNNSYNPVVGASGYEYTITVAAPVVELAALEATSTDRNPLETAINGQYKLQGVKINFGEVVKKYTTDLTGDYGYILDAEGNEVAKLDKCMGGNGTSNNFATPYSATAIETPGTYKVVVKSGVILSADGTKEYKGGEFEFTVAERPIEISPSAEDGFCYNETYENVADFSEFVITVKYAKSDVVINNDVKATMKTGETVYEAAVTVEKSGTTQYITLAFNGEFAEGRYTIDVPAGLYTVDGTANEAYAKSTFTYRKPQLEITRDFDTWESYLDQVWYMPKGAIITIANAESVEVDETKVAKIAVGESVYNSTLNWYYDDWSNAYYIELTFEDFFAEGFEFVKGDYTFTLPAGLYTVNGVANEEAVKAYTYGDPIIEEFNVTEVLPANGSTVEALDAISISFSNNAKPDILPITCGDATYYFVPMSGVYVPVDLMSYEPIVISEPGTYTLDLSELEGLTGDKVFSWTIAEPTAIEEVDAETEMVIYDLTGSRITEIVKPGIYIVNGKKILVK